MALKDKTAVMFHSGILTIGGTVIEIKYNNSSVIFDFGTEFRPELELQEESLETLLENQLIPQLSNIYYKNVNLGEEATDVRENIAVFLSHAHLDHTRMINYLNENIPLYTTTTTKAILEILNKDNDFLLPLPNDHTRTIRSIETLEINETIQIGDIEVRFVPVDHDASGAVGMLITTPTTKIAYTGDLRLHGFRTKETLEFCEQAKESDVLIIEGVSISFDEDDEKEDITEENLINKIKNVVEKNKNKQLTFNTYPANLERLSKIVDEIPRTVVVQANMAMLLKEVFCKDVHYYYLPQEKRINELHTDFEIAYDNLLEDESTYFWQNETEFNKLKKGGIYIHSNAQPLGPFDPRYDLFLEELEKNDIEFVSLSCSGHAYPNDLNKIVEVIQPKLLIPIHSLHPERLTNPFGDRLLPKRGQVIYL